MKGNLTLEETAKLFGITRQRVHQITRRYGIKRLPIYQRLANEALEQYEAGVNVYKLAVRHNTTISTIWAALRYARLTRTT